MEAHPLLLLLLCAACSGAETPTIDAPGTSAPASGSVAAPTPAPVKPVEPAPPPDPGPFAIALTRAAKVGLRQRVTIHQVTEGRSLTLIDGGGGPSKEKIEGDFTLVAAAVAWEIKEPVTRWEYRIERFVRNDGGKAQTLLSPGVVLDIAVSSFNGAAEIKQRKGSLDKQTAKLLDEMFSVPLAGHLNQELFGSKTLQPIGGSWPINNAVLLQKMLGTEKIDGNVTISGEQQIAGHRCLNIEASAVGPSAPSADKAETGEVKLRFAGAFPTDATLPELRSSTELVMKFTHETMKEGHKLEVSYETTKKQSVTVELLGN